MPQVRAAIDALQATMAFKLVFSPRHSEQHFRLCITDTGQITLLPQLLARLVKEAPHVRVHVSTVSEGTPRELALGELDLAIGFMPHIGSDFYQQVVLEERFICLARAEHPRVKGRLTLAAFERELHAIVTTSGTGQYVVDKAISANNVTRRVGVHIPNFIGLAEVIEATDLLCTVPRRAGLMMARGAGVKVFDPPFDIPAYRVRQHWHDRLNNDPGHRWLRSLMVDLF